MKIHYIQPKTEVIVAVTQTVLAGSGGGLTDLNAKKNTYIDDDREESSDDVYSSWPQSKNPWND